MGTQLVKNYFQKARAHAPSIIFIDEIDSLTPRDRQMGYTAHLNQLLTEMDGFVDSDEVVVIGASNMENSIDNALKRSGRFDLKIHIPLPWKRSRVDLIRFFCMKQNVEVGFDVETLAKKTTGFSPADLKSLVNLAKLSMLQRQKVTSATEGLIEIDSLKMAEFVDKENKRQIKDLQNKIMRANEALESTRIKQSKIRWPFPKNWFLGSSSSTRTNEDGRDLRRLTQAYTTRKMLTTEDYTKSTYLGYLGQQHPDLRLQLDEEAVIGAFDRIKLGIRSYSLKQPKE